MKLGNTQKGHLLILLNIRSKIYLIVIYSVLPRLQATGDTRKLKKYRCPWRAQGLDRGTGK